MTLEASRSEHTRTTPISRRQLTTNRIRFSPSKRRGRQKRFASRGTGWLDSWVDKRALPSGSGPSAIN